MKKSELKQIIKEEIQKALEIEDPIQTAFSKRMGTKDNTPSFSNKSFLYINDLPIQKLGNREYISVPSIDNPSATEELPLDRLNSWENKFIEKFGLDKDDRVRFAKQGEQYIPINSNKFIDFRKIGDKSIQSFYDKLKYKGD